MGGESRGIYVITSSDCLTKGYKFNSFDVYAVNTQYLDGKSIYTLDLLNDTNALKSNVDINPYGGYIHDSIPIVAIDEYYIVMGFTDNSVVLHKYMEETTYQRDNVWSSSFKTFEYTGDTNLYQQIPSPIQYKTICDGDSITLAATGGDSYIWSTGDTTVKITVSPKQTTDYEVIITKNECTKLNRFVINVKQLPEANAGEDQTICFGESAILTAAGGDNFEWNTGDTAASLTVSPEMSTQYQVRVYKDGCLGKDSVYVQVNPLPNIDLEEDTTISNFDTIQIDAGEGFNGYNWSDGSTSQKITIIASYLNTGMHNYFVLVTDSNSCTNSDTIFVTVELRTSIQSYSESRRLKIYPNPVKEILNIEGISSNKESVLFQIVNISGQTVYEQQNKNLISNPQIQINLKHFQRGLYFIKIFTDEVYYHPIILE
jgi:hypothetical protein